MYVCVRARTYYIVRVHIMTSIMTHAVSKDGARMQPRTQLDKLPMIQFIDRYRYHTYQSVDR